MRSRSRATGGPGPRHESSPASALGPGAPQRAKPSSMAVPSWTPSGKPKRWPRQPNREPVRTARVAARRFETATTARFPVIARHGCQSPVASTPRSPPARGPIRRRPALDERLLAAMARSVATPIRRACDPTQAWPSLSRSLWRPLEIENCCSPRRCCLRWLGVLRSPVPGARDASAATRCLPAGPGACVLPPAPRS